MTSRLVDYIEAGKRLNPDEREIAALALQHVNETEQAEVDAAWDQEIDRRIAQIVNGDVDLVDADETFAMIYQMIADRRGAWSCRDENTQRPGERHTKPPSGTQTKNLVSRNDSLTKLKKPSLSPANGQVAHPIP